MNIDQTEVHDPEGDNKQTIDFDNILEERIKLGRQQLMIFICGSLLWLSDGAELLVVGFTIPIIQKEWNLSDFDMNWLGSGVFTFWAIGAMWVGRIADKYGRRKPIIAGASGQFICAIISAFVPNYVCLVIVRSIFGFFLGLTAPVISTLFSETFPKKNRGRYFVIMNSAFVLGELITVLVAYFCLSSLTEGNWRLLLVWSSFPGLLCLLIILTSLTESPRYLLICTNKYEKAIKVINKMIKRNHRKYYEAVKIKDYEQDKVINWINEVKQNQTKKPGYKQLFNKEYKWLTIKTMLMWFSLSFVYYGIMYILPKTLFKMHGAEAFENKVKEGEGEKGDNQDFLGIAATAAVEIPSCIVAAILIEIKKVGRKNSMAISAKVMINFCFQIIYPFTAEIYDTTIRSTGCGFNNSVCRIGGIMMPWISYIFFYISNTGPFIVFGTVTIISFLAALSLKEDTTGKALDQNIVVKQPEQKENQDSVKNEEICGERNSDSISRRSDGIDLQSENNKSQNEYDKELIKDGDVQIEMQDRRKTQLPNGEDQ